jgi:hypothetical protein
MATPAPKYRQGFAPGLFDRKARRAPIHIKNE